MSCNVVVGEISIPNGESASDVLNQKILAYQENPQPSIITPCDLLSILFNPIFSAIVNDPMEYALHFFIMDEALTPRRFTPQQYAEALINAGYRYESPQSSSAVVLKRVAEGLYLIFGGDPEALISDADGLTTLYPEPVTCVDIKLMGAELVQVAIREKILGQGDLGKALIIIGFSINEIPLFLKKYKISINNIAKELFAVTNISMVVHILNQPILWPGYSDEMRKKVILHLLWIDLDFKTHNRLFENVFSILEMNSAVVITEHLHTVLRATLSQIVVILSEQGFSLNDIVIAVLDTFSNSQDSTKKKTKILIEIFSAISHPSPTIEQIFTATLFVSLKFKGDNLLSVITHVLHSLGHSSVSIATVLKTHGLNALQLGALLNEINISPQNIANNLHALDYSRIMIAQSLWELDVNIQILSAILIDLEANVSEVIQIFKSIKVPLQTIVDSINAFTFPTSDMMNLLKSLGATDKQIIHLLNIVSFINQDISNGQISGSIMPASVPLSISVNPTMDVEVSENGTWIASLIEWHLADGVYTLQLMSGRILINSVQLVVVDDQYFIFDDSTHDSFLRRLCEEYHLSLEQKILILLELKLSIKEIQKALCLHDASELGRALGEIIVKNCQYDFLTILKDLEGMDPCFMGIVIAEILYILDENEVLIISTADQVKGYIAEIQLEEAQSIIVMNTVFSLLVIPNVQDVLIEIRLSSYQNACEYIVQNDLTGFVINDDISFIYSIDITHTIGSVGFYQTIMTYDPYHLLCSRVMEDEFKYSVCNLKGQKGEGKVKIKIIEDDISVLSKIQ